MRPKNNHCCFHTIHGIQVYRFKQDDNLAFWTLSSSRQKLSGRHSQIGAFGRANSTIEKVRSLQRGRICSASRTRQSTCSRMESSLFGRCQTIRTFGRYRSCNRSHSLSLLHCGSSRSSDSRCETGARELMPEPTVQATFNMPPELHERLKAQAGSEDRSMREIMEDALNLYFERSDKTSPGRTSKSNARDLRPDEAKS